LFTNIIGAGIVKLEGALSLINLDLNVILNMPAGSEMDALVAKEVMGQSVDFEEDASAGGEPDRVWFIVTGGDRQSRSAIPRYSTDIEAAWKVAKKIQSRDEALSLQHRGTTGGNIGTAIWTAWFGKAADLAWANTPSLAICRAALLSFRNSKQLPPGKQVAGNLLSVIEHELAKVMGPIARIIVDDKLAEFGESRDAFPEERVDSFVKAISEEITHKPERTIFSGAMAEFLSPKRWNVKESPGKQVAGNLLSVIEHELAKVMGPIARIIVDDKLAEFGESKDAFPEERVDSFVKAISEEIADKPERTIFTRAMAQFLRPRES
jgi:hypothetical protein